MSSSVLNGYVDQNVFAFKMQVTIIYHGPLELVALFSITHTSILFTASSRQLRTIQANYRGIENLYLA